ncbi:PLAT/LH2 domain-containing protein [Peribacillus sp. NPDC096447]|uniref:PLAT/LH2 domain-containing protein n=1 Tax=Peribacillus sp. NPDC096447 TaxID=3364394 RepID=UPI00380BA54D
MPHTYNVTVYTANEEGAGTDENAYLRLIGNQATAGDYYLDYERYRDAERGSSWTYGLITDEFLGDIKELYLYVESFNNDSPAWKLDYIEVASRITGEVKKWKFPVYSWVGIPNKDPGHPNTINDLWIDTKGVFNTQKSNQVYDKKNVEYEYTPLE